MYMFLPDIYKKSVYSIDYESLKNAGIKIILFDLDNTIIPVSETEPTKKLTGIKPIIMSNSGKKRVSPFKEGLVVDAACSSRKPFKRKYKKILSIYNVKPEEVASVGDQLITDVFGANRMGLVSILVNPISTNDFKKTKINRFFERLIIKHFSKRGVFERGKYYE